MTILEIILICVVLLMAITFIMVFKALADYSKHLEETMESKLLEIENQYRSKIAFLEEMLYDD